MTEQTIKIGVIGAGIGQRHINSYARVPNAQVIAVCDLDEQRARLAAQENGAPEATIFTDYEKLLARDDIDAVSVCLPNALHFPATKAALEAGKHVLCEKPLAMNAEQAQEIVEAAEKFGRKCMVAQVKRFSPQAQYLKKLIENGDLGTPYYGRAYWLRRYGIPGFGTWFTAKEQSGGGPLIDIGVHMLDVAWWLMGCPRPTAAMGATYAQFGPRGKGLGAGSMRAVDDENAAFDVEDLAVGLIRFEDGQSINVEVSWAIHTERDRQGVEIFGDKAGVEWGEIVKVHTDRDGAGHSEMIEVGFGDMWQNQMQHFIDCIIEDRTPDPNAGQGATLMKMLDALYQSAQSGREAIIE